MESGAKAFGHARHQRLIPFPFGLLATAVAFVVGRFADQPGLARTGFSTIAAGVPSGVGAGVPGARDRVAIPSGTRAKRVATWHRAANAVVPALVVVAWLVR